MELFLRHRNKCLLLVSALLGFAIVFSSIQDSIQGPGNAKQVDEGVHERLLSDLRSADDTGGFWTAVAICGFLLSFTLLVFSITLWFLDKLEFEQLTRHAEQQARYFKNSDDEANRYWAKAWQLVADTMASAAAGDSLEVQRHCQALALVFEENKFAEGDRKAFSKFGIDQLSTLWSRSDGKIRVFISQATSHFVYEKKHRTTQSAQIRYLLSWVMPVLALVLLASTIPILLPTFRPSDAAFAVPVEPPLEGTPLACHCVVFSGGVILTPIIYDVFSVIVNFVANLMIQIVKGIYSGQLAICQQSEFFIGKWVECRDENDVTWNVGKITCLAPLRVDIDGSGKGYDWDEVREANFNAGFFVQKAMRHASVIFVLPSTLYHIVHLARLVFSTRVPYSWMSIIRIFTPYMNSGVLAFVLTAILAPALVDADPKVNAPTWKFWSGADGFRTFAAQALSIALVLPIMSWGFLGFLSFPWFALAIESLVAVLVITFFDNNTDLPGYLQLTLFGKVCGRQPADSDYEALEDKDEPADNKGLKNQGRIGTAATYLILPMLQPMSMCLKKLDLYPAASVELPSSIRVLVIYFLILVKVLSLQFAFTAAVIYFTIGHDYWDTVPLVYTSRHWRCNICLMQSRAEQTYDVTQAAWWQFGSLF